MDLYDVILNFKPGKHEGHALHSKRESLVGGRSEEFELEADWRRQAEKSFARAAESCYIMRPGPDRHEGKTLVPPCLLEYLTHDKSSYNSRSRFVAI